MLVMVFYFLPIWRASIGSKGPKLVSSKNEIFERKNLFLNIEVAINFAGNQWESNINICENLEGGVLWMWWILKYLKGKICSQISISMKIWKGSALDVVAVD